PDPDKLEVNISQVTDLADFKRILKNEFEPFNILVSQTELNGNDYSLKLKVKIDDKKSYSDWELKDVFKEILRQDYKSLSGMPRLNLNDLPSLEHSFTEDKLKGFVNELQRTLNAFKKEFGINEMTAREYISTFMKTVVCHIQDYINESAQLSVKIDLDESHEYGSVDYMVDIGKILVLLYEAKAENMNKRTAQVLVQMHSAIEQQLEPTVHISEEYTCNFKDKMKSEKEVLKYITQILQVQAMAFDDDDKGGRPSKHQCIYQEND
ncbi:18576_t:CDS:2, partial [Racocetra fulgida]